MLKLITLLFVATIAHGTPRKVINGNLYVNGNVSASAGQALLPSILFESDNDSSGTGLYRSTTNGIGISNNGVKSGDVRSNGNWCLGKQCTVSTDTVVRVEGTLGTAAEETGLYVDVTGSSSQSTGVIAVTASPNIAASGSAYTMGYGIGFFAQSPGMGSSALLSSGIGILISTQTAGTNNCAISDTTNCSGNRYIYQTDTVASSYFGGLSIFNSGLRTKYRTNDTTTPPTSAELITSFGLASVAGSGFVGVLNDNAAGTSVYVVVSDGASWFYQLLTKAL